MSAVATPNWTHPATVPSVVDGDTLICVLDLGRYPHRVLLEVPIRVVDLWCPELDEPGGQEAKAHAQLLLPRDSVVTVSTRKPNPRDKYGRILGDVWMGSAGLSFAEAMIRAKLGSATKP